MSYFEKLRIQGIRCFGPEDSDKGEISFGHPLTLILGNNGCGKTTIIEALNFATSGELPPGCSGRTSANFVHDPKLTNRSEVKGQIRLALKDVSGLAVSVVRTVQVTQKAVRAEFKRLDQVVSRKDADGKWCSISGRCGDANTEMCSALGVSQAVLSNVLLCHQEDSNWPLDEDTKVKAKFDEIFGSEKYNSCLDEIKSTVKRLTVDQNKFKVELKHLETYRSEASKFKSRLEIDEQRFVKCESDVAEFDARLSPIETRLKELAIKENEIGQLHASLERLKAQLDSIRSNIVDLKSGIQQEFKGSFEELEAAVRNFSLQLKEKQSTLETLETQYEHLGAKLNRNQEALSTEERRFGQLDGDLQANKRRADLRGRAMLSLSEELGVNATISQLSQSDGVHRVQSELERAVIQKDAEISSKQQTHFETVSSLQNEISNLREQRANFDSRIDGNAKQLQNNAEELKKVKESIHEADRSAELLGKLQNELDSVKKQIEELTKNDQIERLKNQISSLKEEYQTSEVVLGRLDDEVADLQRLSQVHAELDIQTKAKSLKDAEVLKLRSRHETALLEILQADELPEQGIKFQLEARTDQLADLIKMKIEESRNLEKQIATKEAEVKHVSLKLKEAKQQLESDEFAVEQACDGRDYDVYTTETRKKLDELLDEKGTLSSAEQFYRRYVVKLQKQKSCPVCHRGFSEEDEISQLISELTLKSREAPSQLRKNKEQLDQVQTKYEQLVRLKQKHDKVAALKTTEIPVLEANLSRAQNELSSLNRTLLDVQNSLEEPQTLKGMAKNLHGDICLLEQHSTESRRLSKEILRIKDKLKSGTGSSKTLDEALREQKETKSSLQASRRKIDALENQLQSNEKKKIRLQEEKHSLQERQYKISGNAQRRAEMSERKEELEIVEGTILAEMEKLRQDSSAVTRQIDQIERKVKKTQESNASEMEELKKKLKDVERRFEEIKQLNSDIIKYEYSGGPKMLEMCKEAIDDLHAQRDELVSERQAIRDRSDSINNALATQQAQERDLRDNIKLRNKMKEEKEAVVKVDELSRKIGHMDSVSLCEERKKLQSQQTQLYSKKKEAEGSLSVLKSTIRTIKEDLNKHHLKFAEKNYCDAVVRIEVIEQAKRDADLFYKALDWAMTNYHKKKIKHINTVINELWRKCYSGNDIDAIQIVTEQDAAKNDSKRRNIKYRVVQTKCGTEIDMRNRCSAGQKVLACLIIRMALAETFSAQCGVLALDEPTTNLDHDNILALGHVLQRLVRMQERRKNFQLLVITHDEYFLKELSKLESVDHYFKLDRNHDGKSKVIKVHI